MDLNAWAARHNISPAALLDLRMSMGITPSDALPLPELEGKPGSEAYAQSQVRKHAAQNGVFLTRNNVGALPDARGVPVRYGLWNESKAQNDVFKSGDLFGFHPIVIGPQHVGQLFARVFMREMKKPGWKFSPNDKHEVAQLACINFINSKGGDASFCTGPHDFWRE